MSWLDKNTHSCYPPTIRSVTVRWKKTCPAFRRSTKLCAKNTIALMLGEGQQREGLTWTAHMRSLMHFCTFNMLQDGWCKGCRTSLWLLEKSGFPLLFLLKSTVICSHGNLRKKVAAAAMHIWQSLLAELASQNKQVIATKCLHLY